MREGRAADHRRRSRAQGAGSLTSGRAFANGPSPSRRRGQRRVPARLSQCNWDPNTDEAHHYPVPPQGVPSGPAVDVGFCRTSTRAGRVESASSADGRRGLADRTPTIPDFDIEHSVSYHFWGYAGPRATDFIAAVESVPGAHIAAQKPPVLIRVFQGRSPGLIVHCHTGRGVGAVRIDRGTVHAVFAVGVRIGAQVEDHGRDARRGSASDAAVAHGLDNATVGELVKADRLVDVGRRADLRLLVVRQHGRAAVRCTRRSRVPPSRSGATQVLDEFAVRAGLGRIADAGVEGAATLVVLASGRIPMVGAHRGARVARLVHRGQDVDPAARIRAEVVPLVRPPPGAAEVRGWPAVLESSMRRASARRCPGHGERARRGEDDRPKRAGPRGEAFALTTANYRETCRGHVDAHEAAASRAGSRSSW